MSKTTYTPYADPVIAYQAYPGSAMLGHKLPKEGLKRGQICEFENTATGLAVNIISSGKAYANEAAQTSLQFYKNHSFYVGGEIVDDNGTSVTITAIDEETSDLYDTITTDAAADLTINTVYYDRTISAIQKSKKLAVILENCAYDSGVDGSTVKQPVSVAPVALVKGTQIPNYFEKEIAINTNIVITPYDEDSVETDGLLNYTTTEIGNLTGMSEGDMVYDTTLDCIKIYSGSAWVPFRKRIYKKYLALITQSGTSAPTAIVLENELGEVPTFAYSDVGDYTVDTVGDVFTLDKTAIFIQQTNGNTDISINRDSTTSIAISTVVGTTNASVNDVLYRAALEIRVYD